MTKIIQIKDNTITLKGDDKFKLFQLYQLDSETQGLVLTAYKDEAKLLVIGSTANLQLGSVVKTIVEKKIEVYSHYFGKIITPFGEVVHGDSQQNGELIGGSVLFNSAPSILDRKALGTPLATGMVAIDTMIPIGRGQRELIIGDRVTGKTTIALNSIINNRETIYSVYVAIGLKKSSVIQLYDTLQRHNALDSTIIIYANPDSTAEQFLAPMIGLAMAEGIAYVGNDVLVVLDDLSKHANVYREISLSIDRNPGREAYPNDLFYTHSRLLERGGRFSEAFNNGSITILPIVETVEEDIASLVPSNIISITDGQIFTDIEKFNKGIYPAVDISLSVSRTGSTVQSPLIRQISNGLKADYAKYEEIKKFMEMSIEISDEFAKNINLAKQLDKILEQFGNVGYRQEVIAFLVLLYRTGKLDVEVEMRQLALVINNFFGEDLVGKMILKKIQKMNKENYDQVLAIANTLVDSFNGGSKGKFGNFLAIQEWETLAKGGKKW